MLTIMHRIWALAVLAAIVAAQTTVAAQSNDARGQRTSANEETAHDAFLSAVHRLPDGGSSPSQAASPEQVVAIPDPALRTVIAARLGKSAGDTITQGDLASLTRLDCHNRGIADLTGLEFAINLRWIDLLDNHVQDASPLSGLSRLRALRLQDNPVADLSPLAGNVALVTLHLGFET